MALPTLRVASACLMLALTAACGVGSATTTRATQTTPEVGATCPTLTRSDVGSLEAVTSQLHIASLEEMADNTVIIGRVKSAKDGEPAASFGEPGDIDSIRRIVTIDVTTNLTGEKTLRTFETQTFGWRVRADGTKLPMITGDPWLEVGTDVLMAVDQYKSRKNDSEWGPVGRGSVHVFCNDHIHPGPGAPITITEQLEGLTSAEVVRLIRNAATQD